ncbi:MAG TPA: hypothetical protein VEC12_15910 [Bacteroidia bacterium]|nr:hypothetical protein [Bacteroidia bacterium]
MNTPNDGSRAFNSYYPSAISTASLAFEELWPTTGAPNTGWYPGNPATAMLNTSINLVINI